MFGITKSSTDRKVFGVLGGIANRFNINSNILRIVYIIGCFCSLGALIACYLLLAIILPNDVTYVSKTGRRIRDAKKVK